jgi:hypothetical protein
MKNLEIAANFLNSIGIRCLERRGAKGFLEGCKIVRGEIHYDPKVCTASNLLHEAGHIAITPSETRHLLDGDVDEWFEKVEGRIEELAKVLGPDDPLMRAYLQASECEATAWAYAAGKAAGLSPEIIIMDHEYDGNGDSVRTGLMFNAYVGINGLRAGGFLRSVKDYPSLERWMQI